MNIQTCRATGWNPRNLAAGVSLTLLVCASGSAWSRAEQERNDSYEQANLIALEEEVTGTIDAGDGDTGDKFRLRFPGAGTASFLLYGYPSDCFFSSFARAKRSRAQTSATV